MGIVLNHLLKRVVLNCQDIRESGYYLHKRLSI